MQRNFDTKIARLDALGDLRSLPLLPFGRRYSCHAADMCLTSAYG